MMMRTLETEKKTNRNASGCVSSSAQEGLYQEEVVARDE